jgi:hypothetical protein
MKEPNQDLGSILEDIAQDGINSLREASDREQAETVVMKMVPFFSVAYVRLPAALTRSFVAALDGAEARFGSFARVLGFSGNDDQYSACLQVFRDLHNKGEH